MARIIPGDVISADFSRGWLSPTVRQPQFASFYQSLYAGANLAFGGDTADVVGSVTLTAAVTGASPAYIQTTGGSAYLQTKCPETAAGTIIAIVRMPTAPVAGSGGTSGAIVSNFDAGNTMMSLSATDTAGGALHTRAPAASGVGCNLQPPTFSDMISWGLYGYRYQTDPTTTLDLFAPTKNAQITLQSASTSNIKSAPLVIGSDPYAVANNSRRGVVQHAFTGIWDYALSDSEIDDVFTVLRNVMAQYGTTI